MPGLIRRSDIDEVRARTNIADIVSEHVTLKSAGVGSMKGLCPFHDERSPSFHVRPQAGFYHCFGCGEGGDVFTFLQKIEHVTFQEAVERLAGRIGYELHYEDGGTTPSDHGQRARILAANAAAAEFFVAQLSSPDAEPGRRFLGERGFDAAAAAHFGIGFAPKSFSALGTYLKTKGFTEQELLAAGLLSQGDRGAYDRFRGRLIWPIRDVTGQTVGFGARKLLDDDNGPKYLNTPDTAVYHKSQVLYGLDLARRDIARGKQVVIVEGYTDVMACHLSGITTAVATCGTSFGVDHIKMIRRVLGDVDNANIGGTGEVIFTFDPDEAGQKAASRAFAEEQRFAAQTFVAVAPEGLDPCDLRLKQGEQAVRRLITTRRPMFEFMIRRVLDAHDLDTVEGRVAALRAAAPVVAGIRDQALSIGYVRNLAKWLGMDPDEVGRAVAAAKDTARRNEAAVEEAPANEPPPQRRISLVELPTDPLTRSERDLLIAILQYPSEVGDDLLARIVEARFTNPDLAVVRDAIATTSAKRADAGWVAEVAAEVPPSYAMFVNQLAVAPVPETEQRVQHYVRRIAADFADRDLLRRKAELTGSLQRLDPTTDAERFREVQRELVRIESDRRALREG